jgi:cellulose synthase/poly-beta-1,6-N-acetylglucosamine synthase-like glycosyltransferase
MTYLFWLTVGILFYIYMGYPFMTLALGALTRRTVRKAPGQPTVSVLIAAFNERDHIAATIQNKLALNYPPERLQIVVVSDGSTDGTDAAVMRIQSDRLLFLRQDPRQGKTEALNLAVSRATGDILVFADANSIYHPDAVNHLVANFSDPTVGYVTGRMAYLNPDGSMTGEGCSHYIGYENALREAENRLGSIVGVNGGIDAVRRTLYEPMRPDQLPDLVLPLSVVGRGYRVVYEPRAVLYEPTLSRPTDEYRMRVRVALRALWTLTEMGYLLNVRRFGLFSLQLFSHKVLRYLTFLFLFALYGLAGLLWRDGWPYQTVFALQTLFFVSAWLGLAAARRGYAIRLLSVPSYFVLVHVASLLAFVKFVKGERQVIWTPRLG